MPLRESPEPRRRKKDYDTLRSRDRSGERDRNRERPKSTRHQSTKSKTSEPYTSRETLSPRGSTSSSTKTKKTSPALPEMQRRRSSLPESRPYPSFSKAHSREDVGSRENVSAYPYTPDPTDLSRGRSENPSSPKVTIPPRARATHKGAPPSPPLTENDPDLRHAKSGSNIRSSTTSTTRDNSASGSTNNSRSLQPSHFSASRNSLRRAEEGTHTTSPHRKGSLPLHSRSASDSRTPSPLKQSRLTASPARRIESRVASGGSNHGSNLTDSDATSVAPERLKIRKGPTNLSRGAGSTASNSQSPIPQTIRMPRDAALHLSPNSPSATPSEPISAQATELGVNPDPAFAPPPPPPPPPPPLNNTEPPRVDYLLQNGGLSKIISKSFSAGTSAFQPQPYQQYLSPALTASKAADVQDTFAPYREMLDGLATVLSKHGSVAVATGYRSVARRLLERLEHVFARNISSEACPCIMCQSNPTPNSEDTGVSWGEVLELVSGRSELPAWPPFSPAMSASGLGIAHLGEQQAPMQKLDIDVPEEYREHYIKQSKKTKVAVQNWLAAQPESQPPAPPQEVDDETLMFAMLTYLEPHDRRLFTALARGLSTIPDSRAPTPAQNTSSSKSDLMSKVSLALQRLYRLSQPPREPECCMYLVKNPGLHSALATLAVISNHEWEILVSGRFDGFLWSGAEDLTAPASAASPITSSSRHNSNPSSRTTTPFSAAGGVSVPPSRGAIPFTPPSRGPTPFRTGTPSGQLGTASGGGGPVALDEETEIAVLAEVEREIYLGMEALEDAFEALHVKAESVRDKLRERSAGLSMSALARRGSAFAEGDVEVRMGTPASFIGGGGLDSAADDEADNVSLWARDMEDRSELAPDDSASNVGWRTREREREHRRRRRPRRAERATPAPVDEEGEMGGAESSAR